MRNIKKNTAGSRGRRRRRRTGKMIWEMRERKKPGKTGDRGKVLTAVVPGLAMAISAILFAVPFSALGAEPGWSQQEDGWHYYLEDGSPAVGWVEVEGKSYYLPQNGGMLKDTVTPDGYYVDQDGAWYEKKEIILETEFQAPQQVRDPSSEWNGKEALNGMRTKLSQRFSGNRSFRVGENAVEFVKIETAEGTTAGSSSFVGQSTLTQGNTSSSGSKSAASGKANTPKETVLLGLYREPGQGRYRIDIRAGAFYQRPLQCMGGRKPVENRTGTVDPYR